MPRHVVPASLQRSLRPWVLAALTVLAATAPPKITWAQDGDVKAVFGSKPWLMTEIDGRPAIRHSPTQLTFRTSGRFGTVSMSADRPGLHLDDGCRFSILPIEFSGRDQSIRFSSPEPSKVPARPCSPSLELQTAKLAAALAGIESYDLAQNELRLIAGGRVLARLASDPSWQKSVLAPRDATFWTAVEIGGNAVPADDRVTLNLIAHNVIVKANACRSSGYVRHGHGEIEFWNLSVVSRPCEDLSARALLAALAQASRYESDRDTLVLHAADGAVVGRFQANISDAVTGSWLLVEVGGQRPTISLTLMDGRTGGSVACNSLSGRVRLGDGIIAFPDGLMTTLKACPGKSLPQTDLTTLVRAERYEASQDRLTFFDNSGNVVARFARLNRQAPR
jgi:heat shock protein HslJ